jgi:hypothetical protein
MNAFDKPLFHFGDQRCRYSLNQIRSFVEEGVAGACADTPVYIAEVAFKANDIIEHVAPMICDRMLSVE